MNRTDWQRPILEPMNSIHFWTRLLDQNGLTHWYRAVEPRNRIDWPILGQGWTSGNGPWIKDSWLTRRYWFLNQRLWSLADTTLEPTTLIGLKKRILEPWIRTTSRKRFLKKNLTDSTKRILTAFAHRNRLWQGNQLRNHFLRSNRRCWLRLRHRNWSRC